MVSDITDLWPEALEYVEMNSVVRRALILLGRGVNRVLYRRVSSIVTLNEPMARVLEGEARSRMHVIYGCIDTDRFRPMSREEALRALAGSASLDLGGKFVVLFSGLMGHFQDPMMVAEVASRLRGEDVVFLLVGCGPRRRELEAAIRERGMHNVVVAGPLPHDLMPYVYNVADLALLLPSAPRARRYLALALPKKFIEYAACGKPILCLTTPCFAAILCLKWRAGCLVEPHDIEGAVKAIKRLKEDPLLREAMGRNARRMAMTLFSLGAVKRRLAEVLSADGAGGSGEGEDGSVA